MRSACQLGEMHMYGEGSLEFAGKQRKASGKDVARGRTDTYAMGIVADSAVGGAQRREGERSQRHYQHWRRERVLSWEGGSEWRMAIEGHCQTMRTGRLSGVRMRRDRVSTFVRVSMSVEML